MLNAVIFISCLLPTVVFPFPAQLYKSNLRTESIQDCTEKCIFKDKFEPVCGTDSKKYHNLCALNCAKQNNQDLKPVQFGSSDNCEVFDSSYENIQNKVIVKRDVTDENESMRKFIDYILEKSEERENSLPNEEHTIPNRFEYALENHEPETNVKNSFKTNDNIPENIWSALFALRKANRQLALAKSARQTVINELDNIALNLKNEDQSRLSNTASTILYHTTEIQTTPENVNDHGFTNYISEEQYETDNNNVPGLFNSRYDYGTEDNLENSKELRRQPKRIEPTDYPELWRDNSLADSKELTQNENFEKTMTEQSVANDSSSESDVKDEDVHGINELNTETTNTTISNEENKESTENVPTTLLSSSSDSYPDYSYADSDHSTENEKAEMNDHTEKTDTSVTEDITNSKDETGDTESENANDAPESSGMLDTESTTMNINGVPSETSNTSSEENINEKTVSELPGISDSMRNNDSTGTVQEETSEFTTTHTTISENSDEMSHNDSTDMSVTETTREFTTNHIATSEISDDLSHNDSTDMSVTETTSEFTTTHIATSEISDDLSHNESTDMSVTEKTSEFTTNHVTSEMAEIIPSTQSPSSTSNDDNGMNDISTFVSTDSSMDAKHTDELFATPPLNSIFIPKPVLEDYGDDDKLHILDPGSIDSVFVGDESMNIPNYFDFIDRH